MRRRRTAAFMVAGILSLAGCSTLSSLAGGSPATGSGSTTAPNQPTGAVGIGAPGTISGSFTFKAQKHSEDPIVQGVIDDTIDAAVNVQLKRDAGAPGEAYVDNGSTYTVTASTKTSRQLGDCTATSETTGDGAFAFTDQPTSIPNQISATVDRASRTVLMFVSISWETSVTGNPCDGRPPFKGENAVTAACPFFGLTAKLIEDNGFDRIDVGCQLPGGETYSGMLTLAR